MVFSGGGFQSALFLGMLDGLESSGVNVNAIVGTCGGAVAAVIAHVLPTHEERRQFIQSEEYYQFLLSPQPTGSASIVSLIQLLLRIHSDRNFSDRLPNLFEHFLFEIPFKSQIAKFEKKFSNDSPIQIVLVAAELEYGPPEVAAGVRFEGRKFYKQVFFTSEKMAPLLEGYLSAVALEFPSSAIRPETEIRLQDNLDTAARASIADPYLMNPMKLDGKYYLTGAIDLYPIEVAHRLAENVVMTYDETFDSTIELPVIYNTFRYNNNDRLKTVHSQYANYWIDRTDSGKWYKKFGFSPGLFGGKIKSRVPMDRKIFMEKIQAQWDWGKSRAIEAVSQKKLNDRSHIRTLLMGM